MKMNNVLIASIFSVALIPYSAFAFDKPALDSALYAADSICQSPTLNGSHEKVHLSAQANANLSKALKKLASAGGNIDASLTKEEWVGVRQNELAVAMKDSNSCKLNVFSILMSDFGAQGWSKSQISTDLKTPHLNHDNGKATVISASPKFDPNGFLCHAEVGSKVKLLDQYRDGFLSHVKVRVLSGTCAGIVGWTLKDNYHL